ncbi:reverse transcriptase domain-containing protein [Tanacetum coccineum]
MMRVTTSFLGGEVAASNHERKKTFPPWKQHEGSQKQNFKKEGFRNQQRSEMKHDRFSLLTKTPKEIFTLDKVKFKAPPPMTTPVEKRNHAKFYEFHCEVGHNTDGCMHMKKQIEEMLKAGKLFSGEIIWPIGQIQLLDKIRDEEHFASPWMNFMVVRSSSPYNGIIGRPRVKKLQAVPSTAHEILKIPVEGGGITLKSSKLVPLECAVVSEPEGAPSATKLIIKERIKVAHADMTGVPRHMAEHRLNVREGCSPVIQKKRGNLEVYVDDLVIKSRTIVRDIKETFKTLREINMKLNPKKCTFRVEEGMFLGYKVNSKGLKVCPDNVDVVLSLTSPKCLKDVQKLNGKLASMNKFLAKSTEKSLPFFKTLKKTTKKSDFHWTTKAEEVFKQMKQLIAELPMLTAPMEKEELIVYLAAAKETVSAVLMTEREAKQMPIYFVSRALRGPELNYTSMEKLILSKPEVAGRLQKWSIELGEYAIHYKPRVSVKGQILADFIVERPKEDSPNTLIEEEEELPEPWNLFTDGSSCTDSSEARLILTNLEGMEFTYALRFRFDVTNNEAEYEALIAGLRIAEQMGVKNLQANVDSHLVANQVNGTYVAKEADMVHYLEKVKSLTGGFKAFTIKQIPRSENKKADALSKIASKSFAHLSKQVLVEELKEKSISEVEVLTVVEEEGDTWMTPIYKYPAEETLPADMKKARAIKRKSWRFTVINGILYKKSFLSPWLRCIGPLQANYVLREIHEGSCRMHAGTRSVVAKALRTGNPQQKLTPITSPWPFYKWGIDIAGPFPKGPGKVKFLITNGLVERANRSLGKGIKARLEARSKNWMEELPHVLWAHRTMIKSSNGDTLFSLTYGTEAVIPAEIGMPTIRTTKVDLVQNNEALEINLDLLEERREEAEI